MGFLSMVYMGICIYLNFINFKIMKKEIIIFWFKIVINDNIFNYMWILLCEWVKVIYM